MFQKIFLSLILIVSITAPNLSQSLETGYGHFGAMIYLQGKLPANNRVEIRRSDQSGEGPVWTIRPAQSVAEFQANAAKMPVIYQGLFPVTEKSAEYYLDKLRGATTIESLPMSFAPNVLFALGLAVWDTTVARGSSYRYQVIVDGVPTGKAATIETTLRESYDWAPKFYSGTNNERIIRCRWLIPYEKKPEVYTYLAYKTPPFEPNYQLVTGINSFVVSGDSILAVFMDTASFQAPGVFQYMIRTVDRFGMLGPVSEYGEGSNFTPASEPVMVYFKATGMTDKPAIQLHWRVLNDWRIRSMKLYRSREYNDSFELIGHFSAQDSSYVDPITDVMESYFYYFEMDDIAQDSLIRTATVTSVSEYVIPAEVPDSMTAVAQGAAIKVSWKRAGYQDRGYYVLRTPGYGEPTDIVSPFIPLIKGQDHYSWKDTSSLMADTYYSYAVVSESIGYAKSPATEAVTLRQDVPLFIPAPTDLKLIAQTDTSFLLTWDDLSADESHKHLGYQVFKKDKKAKTGYQVVTPEPLKFETNYLVLQHILPTDTFMVRAVNIYGHASANSDFVSLHDPFFYKFGPEYLMGKNEAKGIQINWNRPLRSDIEQYNLFRIAGDGKNTKIATLKVEEKTFLDTKIKAGETYYYFITALTRSGLSSEASELMYITR